jgi:hypothetical protein
MQANDGNLYVVKFQGNPQGTRVLANEMLASKLAATLGLQVAKTVVVKLPPEFSEELHFETPSGRQPVRPGLHLGSQLVISSLEGRSYDYQPQSHQHLVRNPEDLVGIQLFDLWTCNRDTRQFVFWRYSRDKKYTVTFIDNGHCFGGPEWSFAPLVYPDGASTPFLTTSKEWLRWADRVATFPTSRVQTIAAKLIPPEWCGEDGSLSAVFDELRIRQATITAEIRSRTSAFNTLGVVTIPRQCDTRPLVWTM